MNLFDECPTDNHQKIGAAAAGGVMTVAWTPAVGELWEVLYVDAFHNDAAGPSCAWLFTDGVTLIQFGNGGALAANSRRSLYSAEFPPRLYLDHRCTLTFTAGAGATNGATATMNVIGRRLRGTL
jgi:hypothetical protein